MLLAGGPYRACAQERTNTSGPAASAPQQSGPTQSAAYGVRVPIPLLSRYSDVGTDEYYDNRTLVTVVGGGVHGNYQLSIVESYVGIGVEVSATVAGGALRGEGTTRSAGAFVVTRAIPYLTFGPPAARAAAPNVELRVGVGAAGVLGDGLAEGDSQGEGGLDALVGLERTWGLADGRGLRVGIQLRAGILSDTSNFLYFAPGLSLSFVRSL